MLTTAIKEWIYTVYEYCKWMDINVDEYCKRMNVNVDEYCKWMNINVDECVTGED